MEKEKKMLTVTKKKAVVFNISMPESNVPIEDIKMICKLFADCKVRGDYNYVEITIAKKPIEEIDAIRNKAGFVVEGELLGTVRTVEEGFKQLGVTDFNEVEMR